VPPPAADAASAAKADAKRLIAEADRRASERAREQAQRQVKDEAERRSAATRLQLCAKAREQLAAVSAGGPVHRYNERGERVYLEDSARDAEIARLRGDVATHCTGGETGAQDAATRQRAALAAQRARCNAARDALRDLETAGPRVPAWEIQQAREKMKRLCTSGP
jgi:hypothetical protein